MARTFCAAVLAVVMATACDPSGQSSTPLPPPSPPTAALAAWKGFPASATQRPIIWFGEHYEHVNGFSTNDGKIAWLCGRFVLGPGIQLSTTGWARATVSWPSGAHGSYESIGSQQAFASMLANRPNGGGSQCSTAASEVITDVRWGTAGFSTDRGTAQMSAWLFEVGAVSGELGYPALDPSAYWGGRKTTSGGGIGGRISSDGLTLTIGVVGGPDTPGPCGEDFSASAAESDTAVAIAIASRIHGGPNVVCTLEGHFRTVTVRLGKPLDGRVVVDAQGNVGSVCPETGDC